ncbi:relaxase/mobilization nuclease domain-containing protein, partial [Ameyamaea chiangmaiensis]
RSSFGRGRAAAHAANRLLTSRSRGVVIKARVARHAPRATPLAAHLRYLRREGVTRDGEDARLFGKDSDDIQASDFAERCEGDRHHFRFIVSPEDAPEMSDLQAFARDLMGQMESDLGTKLDWIAVDHWNTAHPHLHIIVRGLAEDGSDLVIARDYIREGMRARAQDLVTLELGPRTDHDIHRAVERQVNADRWTQLDRQLQRDAGQDGVIDLGRAPGETPDAFATVKLGRLRRLETMGLAHQVGPDRWRMDESAEATLREISERNDIIKRIHRGLAEQKIDRAASSWVLAGEDAADSVIGRLLDRGLDDELRGTAYAVIDGIDGRTHHVRLPNLEAAGDGQLGSIVELRRFTDKGGRDRVALAMRSDFPLERQVTAEGATWLDRQAIAREPLALASTGFGADVKEAMEKRTTHLVEQGLASRGSGGIRYARNLIATLRQRELETLGRSLAVTSGMPLRWSGKGDPVTGAYRQRFNLASGRFAMIDDGLGFELVPWSPSLEKQRGREVSGVMRGDGGIDWTFARKRGLGL